jgi:hypothetical protein
LLIYVLKVPTRIAIGSSLFIAMMNTCSGFLGKLATGQIPWLIATAVVIGAGIGALVGEKIHRRLPTPILRYVYSAMVGLIAARIGSAYSTSTFKALSELHGISVLSQLLIYWVQKTGGHENEKLIGIVLIVCLPRGVHESPDRR